MVFQLGTKKINKRHKIHPSGRILLLDRDCEWREKLFEIEDQYKLSGWIYFVVYAESFSGRFRLEAVRNLNKYLQNGYVSKFFDKNETFKSKN